MDQYGNAIAVWTTYATTYPSVAGVWTNSYTSPNWVGETKISGTSLVASYGHEAMFADGNYIVVYTEFDISGNSTVMARRTVSGILGSATTLDSSSTNYKWYVRVAVSSGSNTAIAVWNENVGANDWNIMASRFDGANWDATPTPLETLTGYFVVPFIAMDSSGNGVVVWTENGTSNIYSNRYVAGSNAWQTAATINDTTEGNVSVATVAMNGSGNAIAVWSQLDATSSVSDAWANTFDGTSWDTTPQKLETDTGPAFFPRIAIDSNGNGMAVWEQYDGNNMIYNIRGNFFDGSNWGSAELVENNTVGDADSPTVAADPTTGNFTTVWTQDDGSGVNDVYSNIYQ